MKTPPRPYTYSLYQSVSTVADVLHRYRAFARFIAKDLGGPAAARVCNDPDGTVADLFQAIGHLKGDQMAVMRSVFADYRPDLLRDKNPVTYPIDKRLVNDLVNHTSITDVLPPLDLDWLPDRNPMIVPVHGIEMTHADGRPGRIIAIYINASHSVDGQTATGMGQGTKLITDTDDPQRRGLHITSVSEVLNAQRTKVDELDYCHLTVPLYGDMTIDELIRHKLSQGYNFVGQFQNITYAQLHSAMALTLRITLPLVTYLMTEGIDITDPVPDKTKPRQRTERQPMKLRAVGNHLKAGAPERSGPTAEPALHEDRDNVPSYRFATGTNAHGETIINWIMKGPDRD